MASSPVNEETPLSDEQRDVLESMLKSGHVAGVTSVYWRYGEGRAQQGPDFEVDERAPRNTKQNAEW